VGNIYRTSRGSIGTGPETTAVEQCKPGDVTFPVRREEKSHAIVQCTLTLILTNEKFDLP